MMSSLFSRLIILFYGILYPAYASYKAVRTKNVREYPKWMMYWIVFAIFTCIETFTDIFLSWFPFYYVVKVAIVFWLLSPETKGSSTLYRKFVHPMLTRREKEIDEYLNQAKELGYSAVLQLGCSEGVNYATNVILQTAIKTIMLTSTPADTRGLQISQSANDLHTPRDQDMVDATDQWLPRSASLSGIEFESYAETEYEQSSNQGLIIREMPEEEMEQMPVGDAGAARLRDLPIRNLQTRRAGSAPATKRNSKSRPGEDAGFSTSTSDIRSRRKLREATPDVDVEGD